LQQQVQKALHLLGFASESRPFSPHLTLARVRQEASPQERHTLAEAVRALALPTSPEFAVQSISLMRSDLRPGGAVYTCLASFPLANQV
jgi:2'-5' RNA ligase